MSKARMPLDEAKGIAEEVKAAIADVCESVVIAGSIRREKEEVGDIELVCVPKFAEVLKKVDLFTEKLVKVNLLEQRLYRMASAGDIIPSLKSNGTRKAWLGSGDARYIAAEYQEVIGVDFFIQLPDRMDLYGWQLFLRTGPGDANQVMVTRRDQGGLKPNHLFIGEGRVVDLRDDTPMMLPTEETVFDVWGMEFIPAPERCVSRYWEAHYKGLKQK
jgi:DNA polymerase/3'-5' exonuclease PolX